MCQRASWDDSLLGERYRGGFGCPDPNRKVALPRDLAREVDRETERVVEVERIGPGDVAGREDEVGRPAAIAAE